MQQLGDSRVQVATLEAQIEFLTNKVEEQDTVDSLYIQRYYHKAHTFLVMKFKLILSSSMPMNSRHPSWLGEGYESWGTNECHGTSLEIRVRRIL